MKLIYTIVPHLYDKRTTSVTKKYNLSFMSIATSKTKIKISVRIPEKLKDSVVKFAEANEINFSQYIQSAVENQIKADQLAADTEN